MAEHRPMTPGGRRVLAAASELFYRRGIHAVGVDTVAEAAGVTKKTLYDRFGSKDALVVAYLRDRDERWRDHLEKALAHGPGDGVARILAVYDAAAEWAATNSPRGCSAVNARGETGDPHHPVAQEATRQKAWLLARFAQLATEAGLPDPHGTAQDLLLLYDGAIVTVGMGTVAHPFARARALAAILLGSQAGPGPDVALPVPAQGPPG